MKILPEVWGGGWSGCVAFNDGLFPPFAVLFFLWWNRNDCRKESTEA